MYIIPVVKALKYRSIKFDITCCQKVDLTAFNNAPRLNKHLSSFLNLNDKVDCTATVVFELDKNLPEQAYKLVIEQQQIIITASSERGAFYAICSLKQIVKTSPPLLPGLEIYDEPDLKIRGVMLDISRGKVIMVDELKRQIDILALLKYNHLQLYVEGHSFEYQSMPFVNKDGNHLTLKEFLEIEAYCEEHYIDFVPNQNGFGHMSDWLKLDQFSHLKMVEGLFYIWGSHRPSSTLNPLDDGSYELVKKMYDDMLPHFKSKYFNMNFDEPFELGHGKTKTACAETSVGQVYINFLNKMIHEVRRYEKTPMLWGDVLINEPNIIDQLPKDAIFIDWGYNLDYNFDKNLKTLNEKNVNFMAAPGTSTWSIVTSRYSDMLWSIKNAATHTIKNNGLGLLVTDWGDLGHLQYLPFSYLGFIYGALCSWHNEKSYEPLIKEFLSSYVTNDYELSSIMIELSRYHEIERHPRSYSSRLFIPILYAEHMENEPQPMEHIKRNVGLNLLSDEEIEQYKLFFDSIDNRLKRLSDSQVVLEVKNSVLLLKGLLSFQVMIKQYINGNASCLKNNQFNKQLDDTFQILKSFLKQHEFLWTKRNKKAGLVYSSMRIENLVKIIGQIKKEVEKYD